MSTKESINPALESDLSKSSKAGPNHLPHGMTKELLDEAIIRSGYPLQQVVATKLEKHKLSVRHEWAFQDPITSKIRAMDLLAEKILYKNAKDLRARPELSILVECKRSPDPYVFFLSDIDADKQSSVFPLIAGLKSPYMSMYTPVLNGAVSVNVNDALGLHEHKFITKISNKSLNFTKAALKGGKDKVVLSGDDPYSSLILPLVSAMREFSRIKHPAPTIRYFDTHLVIGLAVVDAPMVGVRVTQDGHDSESVSWVRVFRHEPSEDAHKYERDDMLYAIDVVHIDYLETYLENDLLPYAKIFGEKVIKKAKALASGKESIEDLPSNQNDVTLFTRSPRIESLLKRIKGRE